MKLEIELDLNKIDYDAINKQITEKISQLNIKEEYNIESRISNKIDTILDEEINDSYNSYLDKSYWGNGTTAKGRELIENLTKEKIENHTKKVIEDIFTSEYSEDTMREVMLKIIPDIFASVLFKRMESALFTKEDDYYSRIHNMVRGEIDCAMSNVTDKLRY